MCLELYLTHQLLTDVQIAHNASREQDVAFEHEAIPWIDDVYRFALSLTPTNPTRTTSCRTPSCAPTVRGTRICRAATAAAGSLRFAAMCFSAPASERGQRWSSMQPSWMPWPWAPCTRRVAREGFDDIFARLDLAPAIAAALTKIPEPFRSTLIIVDVEDQSYESAAEVLGVPIGTVRSRLFRGRRLMQSNCSRTPATRASPRGRRLEQRRNA